jgi:hypothetical protein
MAGPSVCVQHMKADTAQRIPPQPVLGLELKAEFEWTREARKEQEEPLLWPQMLYRWSYGKENGS